MFQFPGCPPPGLCVQPGVSGLVTQYGLPHSDIPGSSLASSSPRHFAGSRVLHRRLVPRHPPWTLSSLSAYFHSSTAENGLLWIQDLAVGFSKKSFRLFDLFGCQGSGGDERTRTADPLLAKQVLSQLSYIPEHTDQPRRSLGTLPAYLPPHAPSGHTEVLAQALIGLKSGKDRTTMPWVIFVHSFARPVHRAI